VAGAVSQGHGDKRYKVFLKERIYRLASILYTQAAGGSVDSLVMMFSLVSKKVFKIGATYVAAIIFLLSTSPKKLPSVMLVIPFALFFLALYLSAKTVLERNEEQSRQGAQVLRPRLGAFLAAGFPVLLLVLQSIGQLTVKDLGTAVAIFTISYFYVARFSADVSNS
jgi:hypothetical protein